MAEMKNWDEDEAPVGGFVISTDEIQKWGSRIAGEDLTDIQAFGRVYQLVRTTKTYLFPICWKPSPDSAREDYTFLITRVADPDNPKAERGELEDRVEKWLKWEVKEYLWTVIDDEAPFS